MDGRVCDSNNICSKFQNDTLYLTIILNLISGSIQRKLAVITIIIVNFVLHWPAELFVQQPSIPLIRIRKSFDLTFIATKFFDRYLFAMFLLSFWYIWGPSAMGECCQKSEVGTAILILYFVLLDSIFMKSIVFEYKRLYLLHQYCKICISKVSVYV